jgi:predicted dehydrogenase
MMAKDPSLVLPDVRRYVHLPGGHQESWTDAFLNLMRDAYHWIREGGAPGAKPEMLPTFEDGYRSACVVDAMLRSHAVGGVWEKVRYTAAEGIA